MKTMKNWGRALVAALLLAGVGVGGLFAATSGTNSLQQALFEMFCDACGQPTNTSIRNLVASTVTLQDAQTVTGVKTFSAAPVMGSATVARGTASSLGTPYILAKSSIPFIKMSSGSVSAIGAVTGITALPAAYPNAYCYFPANILATTIAAGYYYCTCSTTTACTAFLNTYTSGIPTIPSSPTAVSDGKGSYTGDTTERQGQTITVPAGAMGANGALRITTSFQVTNNANSKVGRVRFNGFTGTAFLGITLGSLLVYQDQITISNRGATNVQTGSHAPNGTAFAAGTTAISVDTIDTTAATTVVFTNTQATATDNAIVDAFVIEVLSDGT